MTEPTRRRARDRTADEFRVAFTVVWALFVSLAVVSALSDGEVIDWPLWTALVPLLLPLVLALTLGLLSALVAVVSSLWTYARRKRKGGPRQSAVQPAPPICGQCQQARHALCVGTRGLLCGCSMPGCGSD